MGAHRSAKVGLSLAAQVGCAKRSSAGLSVDDEVDRFVAELSSHIGSATQKSVVNHSEPG